MKILSIETSCDETSVAILECLGGLKKSQFKILSNVVLSQIDIHKEFGGVVPNLAKREHQKNLVLILMQTLKESGMLKLKIKSQNEKFYSMGHDSKGQKIKKLRKILQREPELLEKTLEFLEKYEKPKIDLIAVTRGPGLEPALWVGVNFARVLSFAWQIPVLGINHLEGHIFSVLLLQNREISKSKFLISNKIQNPKFQNQKIQFPAIALVVSGGHTEIVLMRKWLDYKIIGRTLDDAAGEAFDKAARILGLGYPGGPEISKQSELFKLNTPYLKPYTLNPSGYSLSLPRPMLNSKDFNFSFSGLKTAVLYLVQNLKKSGKWSNELIPQIAYEFQEAAIDVLVKKSLKAVEKHNVKTFILCGGVSANYELRERLLNKLGSPTAKFGSALFKLKVLMPDLEFSGDNAAMIGAAAYPNYLSQKAKMKPLKIAPPLKADGNLNF